MNVLIIGGAGFIGHHCALYYLRNGNAVTVVDNLSRNGARANLDTLLSAPPTAGSLQFTHTDVRNAAEMRQIVRNTKPDLVVHQAAQVAVTTSVADPRLDFEVNAVGTFNVLEAIRLESPEAFVVYASTNKVYGGMEDLGVVEEETRFRFKDLPEGVDEFRTIDFHSPYACSKGAADQYVHDYHRIYGLRTAVFRQSCIYGTRQYGIEDQGWLAWFTIAHALQRPVTIYGSGKQVRDVLWVEDLVDAYDKAWKLNKAGSVYNMGGGRENTLSLLELLSVLEDIEPMGRAPDFGQARPGDQPVYIANATRARDELNWVPTVCPFDGVQKLLNWAMHNKPTISRVLGLPS